MLLVNAGKPAVSGIDGRCWPLGIERFNGPKPIPLCYHSNGTYIRDAYHEQLENVFVEWTACLINAGFGAYIVKQLEYAR